MATLDTLPYETLTQILAGLSNTDLVHISCLSPRLRAVAEPMLYKAPYLSEANRPSLAIFLRTVLLPGRESVATHVKSLRVAGWCGYHSLDTPGLPHSPGSYATELVFLLHLLPSLQALEIAHSNTSSDFPPPLESHDGQLSTLPLALHSLHEFCCAILSFCGRRARSILTFLGLLCNPSISTPINRQNGLVMPVADHTPAALSITILRVSDGLPIAPLRYLLKDLTALTHFSYSAFVLHDFDMHEFMHALEPLRNTLQYLHLDFTTEREPDIEDALPFIGGSLRTWPVLRTLVCGLMPLLGKHDETSTLRLVNVLPPSLRELEILQDHYWTYVERMTQAVELMEQMETVVPMLKSLVVVQCWDSAWPLEERLALLCKDAGVLYDEGDSFTLEVGWEDWLRGFM